MGYVNTPELLPGYRGHSAIVRHNTNFTTVHTQVTIGGCSVEYMNKLLCQFTSVVEHRMLYTSVLSICMTLLQGHTKSKFVFQFTIVCLRSYWAPVFRVFSSLSATAALFYSEK